MLAGDGFHLPHMVRSAAVPACPAERVENLHYHTKRCIIWHWHTAQGFEELDRSW